MLSSAGMRCCCSIQKEASSTGVFGDSFDDSGWVPKIGLGIGVPINDRFEIDAEWSGYLDWDLGLTLDPELAFLSEGSTEVLALGVRWKF